MANDKKIEGVEEQNALNVDLVPWFEKTKEMVKPETLNILVVGKTGVGKSTLINAVFGKKLAKAGSGRPITDKIQKYDDANGLVLYDSVGLELGQSSDGIREIKDFLSEIKNKNANEQIHLAWLCIQESGRRIEEEELLQALKNERIPVVVVITKAQQDEDANGEKFSEKVRDILKIESQYIVQVRAEETILDDGYKLPMRGIKDLICISGALLPEAKQLAFDRKQSYDFEKRREACKRAAEEKVKYYMVAAGTIAASPIPFSDIALLLPTQGAMIYHISKIYDLDLDMEGAKRIVPALIAASGMGFAVRAGVGSVLKFIPVVGTLAGGALNASVASATTKAMGDAYISFLDKNFEKEDQNLLEMITPESFK